MPMGHYGKTPSYPSKGYLKQRAGLYSIKSSTEEITEYENISSLREAIKLVKDGLRFTSKKLKNPTIKIYGELPYTNKRLLCAIYKNHRWSENKKNINKVKKAWK